MQIQFFKLAGYFIVLVSGSMLFAQRSAQDKKRLMTHFEASPSTTSTDGEKFENVFIEKGRISLRESRQYAIGSISDAGVSNAGKIYLADPQNHCVAVYSPVGQLIQQIGRQGMGPGEFQLPLCLELYDKTIYVSDIRTSRVSLFAETGEFLNSFVTSAEHYVPEEIKINSKGNIYLNGPAFDAPQNPKAYQLHKYSTKFDYEKSFYPFNRKIVELNLWSERGITLDIDDLDNLYIAEPIEYKISKYNESGEFLASFTRNAKFYIPPSRLPDMPEKKEEQAAAALRAWLPTWTHLIRLVCYKGMVLVQFRVHQPKQYLIEIFDYDGNYVTGEILTDNLLLCSGKDGFLYFLTSVPSEAVDDYSIGQFTTKLNIARE